ncbi:MAG: hypothetical protein IPM54_13250 [Polyangiaceae bacterium]|nr:hypothetical protein [Polyangiaceae bacterium]
MKNMEPESVILCEGYHDRAFLSGLLQSHGCTSLKEKPYRGGQPLRGRGQYGFRTPSGEWLRVAPVDGDGNLLPAAKKLLEDRHTNRLSRVLVVRDEDADESMRQVENLPHAALDQRAKLGKWARDNANARPVPGTNDFELDGGIVTTRLSFLIWQVTGLDGANVPSKQTLERLVCAAIDEAYGPRCKAVWEFINSRPAPPAHEKLHKTHAASHMAGWYSERGYEGFFLAIWDDEAIRDALRRRLDAAGATPIIAALLGSG